MQVLPNARSGRSWRAPALAAAVDTIAPSVAELVAASARHLLERQRGTRLVVRSSRRQLPGPPRHSPVQASPPDPLRPSAADMMELDGVAPGSLQVHIAPWPSGLAGFERASDCLGGVSAGWLDGAGRRLVWHLPAAMMAGRGPVWPDAGGR